MRATAYSVAVLSVLASSSHPSGMDTSFPNRQPTSSKFNTIVSVQSRNEQRGIYSTADSDLSLSTYMKLPVSQYALIKMPLGATLTKALDTEEFKLEVPKVKFFHLECKPTVYCTVSKSEGGDIVTIRSEKCILGGSPIVDSLNSHYNFNVMTQFTWIDKPREKAIISNSKILVFVDPPFIFKAFSKALLESTGNLVMQVALNGVERMFVKALAEDYRKWATEKEYRSLRAALSLNDRLR